MKYSKRKSVNTGLLFPVAAAAVVIIVVIVILVAAFSGGGKQSIETSRDFSLRVEPDISSSVLQTVPKGTSVTLDTNYTSEDNIWKKIILSDGTVGYIYSESVEEDGSDENSDTEQSVNSEKSAKLGVSIEQNADEGEAFVIRDASASPTQSFNETIFDSKYENLSLNEKIEVLKKFFPDGKYWNHIGIDTSDLDQDYSCMIVTDEACDHTYNGYEFCNEYDGATLNEYSYDYNIQCLGFASMVSDFLFGRDADIETFYDFDELGVGDHIRYLTSEHSAIVIEKGDDYIRVVECNRDYENCEIEWGREITSSELYDYDIEFLRRVN